MKEKYLRWYAERDIPTLLFIPSGKDAYVVCDTFHALKGLFAHFPIDRLLMLVQRFDRRQPQPWS